MKALLRGIVSMAFSTIDDQKAQHTAQLTTQNNHAVSRFAISPPPPIPADEIYKPLSSSDPIPFGAITKVESAVDTSGSSNSVRSLLSTLEKEDAASKEVELEDLVPDNLSDIKGLNPIAITGLNKRGIITFLQIANLTDQEIADIEEDLDLPGCFNRFSWRYQSRQLHLDND